MERLKPKMIVMDLDRTLLDNDKNISNYTLSILKKCRNIGIKLGIATARSDRSGKRIIDIINPDIMILNDGALIKNRNGEIIYKKLLSKKTADGIIGVCINNTDIKNIVAETEKGVYVTYEKANHPDFGFGIRSDFREPLFQEAYKICVEIIQEKIALDIEKKFSECKVTYNFSELWYRFAHKEIGKMNGVKIISKNQNIPLSEIIAFGDDYNDIEMIKGCGIGVAMENAIDEVKSVAEHICGDNNNDGVGKWIEENIL